MDKKNEAAILSTWVDERLALLTPSPEWQPDPTSGLARLRKRHLSGKPRIQKWLWMAAGAIAILLCVIAIPESQVLAYRCLDCSVALWQTLSSPGPTRAKLKTAGDRRPAADFVRDDANGKSVRLSDFKGQVVLLNFWATWCGGCQAEIPWFVEFERQYKKNGFSAIGVSVDADGWKSVKPYIMEKGVNYPIVIGNSELSQLYRVSAMPVTLLIDRDGRIAASHVGLVSKNDYKNEIEALLQEKIAETR